MRRFISFTLLFAVFFLLTACNKEVEEITKPANFYYLTEPIAYNEEYGVISAEIRETAQFALDSNLIPLLDYYLAGPSAPDYRSPFPSGTIVEELTQSDDLISVYLSEQFAKLSGVDLTTACACLTRTLMDLTGATSVKISVPGQLLGGKDVITMTAKNLNFLLPDGTEAVTE